MCGIAGIVALEAGARVDEHRLSRMRDVLRHRGPDGSGFMVDGPVGLAHTRLAIIDVAKGDQPMRNEAGDVWIVFNGEIYNHAELRPDLEARGHRYRSRSDTETIVHLYEERGEDVVQQLQGMFAFAIWDRRRQSLLLGRDRLGIKPLYYAVTGTSLLFASEIKALLATGLIRPEFNDRVLPEFLSTRFVAGEDTFFKHVFKLMPGHVLTWSPGCAVHTRRYWQLPSPNRQSCKGLSAGDLRQRLEGAVSRHLMSDVPLGVFLSGGIDSSVLAAMVARATRERIRTFSVGFDDREANELPYARLAAARIGAEHHEVTVTPADFFATLPHAVWHEDEPVAFASSIPLYFVSRLAREHVKVVLTGEGADELFLGYNRYRVTRWNARLGQPYWAVVPRRWQRRVSRVAHTLRGRVGRLARRTFLALEPGVRELYLENFAVVSAARQARLLSNPQRFAQGDAYDAELRCYEAASGGLLDRIARTDMQTYLVELLMKQDQMSMAASIESRVPFLDDQLVEHLMAIPADVKLPGWQTKALLRAAVKDLVPTEILTRSKMGFPVPLGRWFAGAFGSIVDEFVLGPRAANRGYFNRSTLHDMVAEHRAGLARHADALWLLTNLEVWLRIHCDGEEPDRVMRTVRHPAPLVRGRSVGNIQCAFSG